MGTMQNQLIDIDDLSKALKIPAKTIRNKLSNGTYQASPNRPRSSVARVRRYAGDCRPPERPTGGVGVLVLPRHEFDNESARIGRAELAVLAGRGAYET
jgi:hypothetical protein